MGGLDEVLSAGTYIIESHEKLPEGISFPASERILTLIHLHTKFGFPSITRALTIDPNELSAALMRDQATAEIPADTDTGRKSLKRTTETPPQNERPSNRSRKRRRGDDVSSRVNGRRPKPPNRDFPKPEAQASPDD